MRNIITDYHLALYDQYGRFVTTIDSWHKLQYAKKENDFGSLTLDVPPIYPIDIFKIDGRIEVHRSVGGYAPYLELDTVWLIRIVRNKYDRGEKYIHILCHDATNILDRRIVAYPCNSAYTKKKVAADNMIRQIVRENYGSSCTDSARNISSWMDIESDVASSIFPILEKEFCRQKTLPLFQDICNESYASGKYLAFDVNYASGKFVFNVYPLLRGTNRGSQSSQQFIFSRQSGNLEYITVTQDHSEEYNYIYAGGSGKDDVKIIATASNSSWINISPINRREDFINADDKESVKNVESEAKARLKEAGPKNSVNGHIIQTPTSLYGVHYGFGDIVTVKEDDYTIDVHLDSVSVVVDENGDDINIYARNLEDNDY